MSSARPTVAIRSAAEMGGAIGAMPEVHGVGVVTNLERRSVRTRAQVEAAGVQDARCAGVARTWQRVVGPDRLRVGDFRRQGFDLDALNLALARTFRGAVPC